MHVFIGLTNYNEGVNCIDDWARRYKLKRILLILIFLAACGAARAQDARSPSLGQTIYLPVYSSMLFGNLSRAGIPSRVLLSAMVSVRNTDPSRSVRLTSVQYHESTGKLLREFQQEPVTVEPLSTREYFVELHDDSGGSGATFLIRWESDTLASPPLVEAIHANLDSARGVVFITQGITVSTP